MICPGEAAGAAFATDPSPAFRVFIVDDHPLVRRGLVSLVGDEPGLTVCGEIGTMEGALPQILQERPDLVIVDLSLKDGHGLDLIKQVRDADNSIRTLALSIHDASIFAERSLQAGAAGYLNKSCANEELAQAIRQVLDGRIYLSAADSEWLLRRVSQGETSTPDVEKLSDRELAVFQRIGEGLTTRQIADQLTLSHKTVETHRERIKKKLGLTNSATLMRRAVEWVLRSADGLIGWRDFDCFGRSRKLFSTRARSGRATNRQMLTQSRIFYWPQETQESQRLYLVFFAFFVANCFEIWLRPWAAPGPLCEA
jgi:DNA-binding NarL/FixJ family response regulator